MFDTDLLDQFDVNKQTCPSTISSVFVYIVAVVSTVEDE